MKDGLTFEVVGEIPPCGAVGFFLFFVGRHQPPPRAEHDEFTGGSVHFQGLVQQPGYEYFLPQGLLSRLGQGRAVVLGQPGLRGRPFVL